MSSAGAIRAFAKQLPGVRILRHAPPYLSDSVLANQLGYQPVRMIGKRLLWILRGRRVAPEAAEYVDVALRDGVVVIPNFLSPEDFATVRREFERASAGLIFRPVPFYVGLARAERGRIHAATIPVTDVPSTFPGMIQHLVTNPLLWKIVAGIVRVPVHGPPSANIDVYQRRDESAPDNDVETVLHADLHSATVKAFFYLNDVDERNGAFIYAKGSARVTSSRLKHEYDISVRSAKLKRGDTNLDPALLAERGPNRRNIVRPRLLNEMNIVETSVCGPANTLIIANNLGFHRRGDFSSDKARESVLLNFRHLQRPFWS